MITGSRTRDLGAARRTRRAVGFLWFCIVTIPVLFFSAGLAVDFTKIIVADREARNLVDAAATAGAYQFQPGKPWLHPTNAKKAAEDLWKWGTDHPSMNSNQNAAPMLTLIEGKTVPKVTFNPVKPGQTGPTQITVTVEYQVNDLMFIKYFTSESTLVGNASATAFVCNPSVTTDYTAGYCIRPEFRPNTGD